jgi:hypothetical protein
MPWPAVAIALSSASAFAMSALPSALAQMNSPALITLTLVITYYRQALPAWM